MRYAYALTSALLLGGAVATVAVQHPATAQVAQNEPGAIEAVAPKAGAPMSFADMVARLQPAVVNVSTAQRITQTAQANPFAGTPFGELFGGGGGGGGDGQPVTREAQSLGSGFLISPDGYIVTNNHVIAAGAKGATVESITVTLADRREYKARLVGRDQASDLALLKIDAPGQLPFVKFGDSTRSRVGDWVVAIGQPFGLGGTVTAGIISALHRQTGLGSPYDRFIQTDAAINQGNSGGPMFNLNGDVIGINSQIYSQSGGNVGIGFAIPAEEARPIIDKLRSGSKISRGYLGVGIQPVTSDVAAALGVPTNQGEVIGRVEPGGPGARAGLRTGDVVARVNGTLVTPDTTLAFQVANIAPGAPVRLDIIRDGRPQTINATVGTRPPEDQIAATSGEEDDGIPGDGSAQGQPAAANALGLTVQPLTPAIARSLSVDTTTQGVVVASVDPQSDAGLKGLKRGDVISAVNSVPVRTGADVARAVAGAKAAGRSEVLLLLTRGKGNTGYIAVKFKG